MLQELFTRKNLIAVGLNSGTSADGLDLAAVEVNLSSKKPVIRFLDGRTVMYPDTIQKLLNDAVNNRISSVDDLVRLDRELGCFYGEETGLFCSELKRRRIKPDIIASHGQTVRHLPGKIRIGTSKESGTLQLGHAESISERTGLVTISDFRQADIASGGEGAPITGHAMWYLFASGSETRLVVNIGGISNYFLIPRNKPPHEMVAEDCGPGNSLLDIITQKYFGRKYDREGQLASRGSISERLLAILLADDYLRGKYGPSTGRERFGERFVRKIVKASSKIGLSKLDILASAAELTAVTISRSIKPHLGRFKVGNVYLFGGGLKNSYLTNRLRANLPETKFLSVDRLKADPDYVEAACYAVMGAMTILSMPSGLPDVTGAKGKTIAGRIIQPSRG